MRARREAHRAEARLGPYLRDLPGWGGVVAGYMAIRGEIPVIDALRDARAGGAVVALPRVTPSGLVLHRWEEGPLRPGVWGIPEPDPSWAVLSPDTVTVFLVPGVAFDPAGGRLGQGAGYYDRLLPGTPGQKVGVAWSFQVVEQVPADPHDIPMDAVLTERGWLKPGR